LIKKLELDGVSSILTNKKVKNFDRRPGLAGPDHLIEVETNISVADLAGLGRSESLRPFDQSKAA
jgi:hypothetical protein